jgi:predicted amidohydrolase YtcJ
MNLKLPPLYDHHNHLSGHAFFSLGYKMSDFANKSLFLDALPKLEKDKLHLFVEHDNAAFPLAANELHCAASVVVLNRSLHGYVMNKAAEQRIFADYSGTVKTENPKWVEKNLNFFYQSLFMEMKFSGEIIKKKWEEFKQAGVGKVDDMCVRPAALLNLALTHANDSVVSFWTELAIYKQLARKEKEKIAGIKIFCDGALGVYTAALSKPYRQGNAGINLLLNDEGLMNAIERAEEEKDCLSLHVLGDAAIDQALKIVAKKAANKRRLPTIRFEHAEFISQEQAYRAKSLGIVLCMQPNFSADAISYRDRLPPGFDARINNFRMLIDDVGFIPGADLLFGSDGMPTGVEAALQWSLFPPFSSQKLLIQEFIDGYCLEAEVGRTSVEVDIDMDRKKVVLLPQKIRQMHKKNGPSPL